MEIISFENVPAEQFDEQLKQCSVFW
ncbi:hypothetical protein MNBD_GAMMA11-1316 [hydrothermal vent metagenome]|uniref:Uncharacterized protein n=1 Tax=hydrothermal vent metagenome TaxID=652676 RepID=A0A3B0X3J8_9ZZZZ